MVFNFFILLDVDNTLVINNLCTQDAIVWTGSRELWYKNLQALKKFLEKGLFANEKNEVVKIKLDYGIATAKELYQSDEHKKFNLRGDSISGIILEDLPEYKGQGLKDLLDDPRLSFFVLPAIKHLQKIYKNSPEKLRAALSACKTEYALKAATLSLQEKYKLAKAVPFQQGYIIDDQQDICEAAKAQGFNAFHAKDFHLEKNANSAVIQKMFDDIKKSMLETLLKHKIKNKIKKIQSSHSSSSEDEKMNLPKNTHHMQLNPQSALTRAVEDGTGGTTYAHAKLFQRSSQSPKTPTRTLQPTAQQLEGAVSKPKKSSNS